ncbi:hypothetical protein Bbelb_008020 [Branchiostoma belcheri]|nr:hypothetical protein Bbelb_008020 [Branchiostoma belcheri]
MRTPVFPSGRSAGQRRRAPSQAAHGINMNINHRTLSGTNSTKWGGIDDEADGSYAHPIDSNPGLTGAHSNSDSGVEPVMRQTAGGGEKAVRGTCDSRNSSGCSEIPVANWNVNVNTHGMSTSPGSLQDKPVCCVTSADFQ